MESGTNFGTNFRGQSAVTTSRYDKVTVCVRSSMDTRKREKKSPLPSKGTGVGAKTAFSGNSMSRTRVTMSCGQI